MAPSFSLHICTLSLSASQKEKIKMSYARSAIFICSRRTNNHEKDYEEVKGILDDRPHNRYSTGLNWTEHQASHVMVKTI